MGDRAFPSEFLARLREQVDIAAVIGEDIALRPAGRRFVGKCPFHVDRTPSLQVDPSIGLFRCWGCSARGDAVQWLRDLRNFSYGEAVVFLARAAGISLPPMDSGPADLEARRRRAAAHQVLSAAQKLYRQGLQRHPPAMRYLADIRQVTEQSIARFGLGAVGTGIYSFLQRHDPQALLESGLVSEGNDGRPYERFRHRIMFPIHNERGDLISFGGRKLRDDGESPKYLNGPETGLFRKDQELYGLNLAKDAIRKGNQAVVVEGYFDVIRLHQAGDPRAVAPLGTAISVSQIRRLLRLADEVIFVFDGDAAGRKASLSAAKTFLQAMQDGKAARFVFLPDGEDPDTFALHKGSDAWLARVADGPNLSKVLADYVSTGLDMGVPEAQVRACKRAQDVLRATNAPLFAQALQGHLERLIGMSLVTETKGDADVCAV